MVVEASQRRVHMSLLQPTSHKQHMELLYNAQIQEKILTFNRAEPYINSSFVFIIWAFFSLQAVFSPKIFRCHFELQSDHDGELSILCKNAMMVVLWIAQHATGEAENRSVSSTMQKLFLADRHLSRISINCV